MATNETGELKRPYELGKRLEQMDQTRAAILRAARAQLEAKGYRQLTMASLAAEGGVTRQTIHNLFGTKSAVLEALFDSIAQESGMEEMRSIMTHPSAAIMLERFVDIFSRFWSTNRLFLRRVHGIGAIDPEFGAVLAARNRRRLSAATRIVSRLSTGKNVKEDAATLTALTSFEFFDGLAENTKDEQRARTIVLELAQRLLISSRRP